MTNSGASGLLRFVRLAMELKQVRRQGWVDRGVEDPESVADHSWSVALVAWLLAYERPELDRQRVLLLGIVHDLPEALAGDTTPFDVHRDASGVISGEHFLRPPEYASDADLVKRQREEAALEEMVRSLPGDLADEIRDAWREYDDAVTPEARFVKQVDKLETAMQALGYQDANPDIVIASFLSGADRDINDAVVRRYLEDLTRDR